MIKIETKITNINFDKGSTLTASIKDNTLAASIEDIQHSNGSITLKFWTESGPNEFQMTRDMARELASQILREKWIL